jgi:hypothetical protein
MSAVRIREFSALTRPAGVAPYDVNDFSDAAIFLRPGCPSCDPPDAAEVLSFAVVDSCRPSARSSLCSAYESRYATGLIRIIGNHLLSRVARGRTRSRLFSDRSASDTRRSSTCRSGAPVDACTRRRRRPGARAPGRVGRRPLEPLDAARAARASARHPTPATRRRRTRRRARRRARHDSLTPTRKVAIRCAAGTPSISSFCVAPSYWQAFNVRPATASG